MEHGGVITAILGPQVGVDILRVHQHGPLGHWLAGGLAQDGAVRDAVRGGGDRHGKLMCRLAEAFS